MKRHRSTPFLLGAALVLSSATAAAEKPKEAQRRTDQYGYTFGDDSVLADALGPLGTTIRIPPYVVRVTLIRPRTAFIVELLKSVEKM
jgi:hypothetical protein